MKSINAFVKDYYDNPQKALEKIGAGNLGALPW